MDALPAALQRCSVVQPVEPGHPHPAPLRTKTTVPFCTGSLRNNIFRSLLFPCSVHSKITVFLQVLCPEGVFLKNCLAEIRRASSAISSLTGHSLIEMFALVFHYAELLQLLFTRHPAGTLKEEKHKPHQSPAKLISVNSTVVLAHTMWVIFCCLVLLLISFCLQYLFLRDFKKCPMKAEFA